MKTRYLVNVFQQLLVAVVVAGCATQPSVAQMVKPYDGPVPRSEGVEPTLRDCSAGREKETCVDVLVRYHLSTNKIELLDPQVRRQIARCQICDPSKPDCKSPCRGALGTNVVDVETVWIIHTSKSPGCIIVGYSGGLPIQACF